MMNGTPPDYYNQNDKQKYYIQNHSAFWEFSWIMLKIDHVY